MKKTLFAALALVSMASCSNEEIVEATSKEAIAFENAFVDNSTRAYDPSYTNSNLFGGFNVYGFVEKAELFPGTLCKAGAADGETIWSYDGAQYWIPGANYNFCAVAPATVGETTANWTKTACSVTDAGAINTTLSFTNDGTQDLLYAEHELVQGKLTGNDEVDFTFRHLLSRVKFTFANGYNATGATLRVKNIKINNAYSQATVALTSSSQNWTEHSEDNVVLEFGNALSDNANAATDVETIAYNTSKSSYNALFLIPNAVPTVTIPATGESTEQTVKGYKVTFDVDLLVGDNVVKTYNRVTYVDFTPEAGKSYNISTTITAKNIDPDNAFEPIQFTVKTLPGWGNDNTVNM